VGPTAEELGSGALLEPLRRLDQAAEQLELGRREGLESLSRRLIEFT
jgi:hypothetical protein